MKKMLFFEIIKTVVRIALIFLALLVWTRYYETNLTKAIILAGIGTLLLDFSLHILSQKIKGRKELPVKQKELCENISLEFMLSPLDKVINFYYELVKKTANCTKRINFVKTNSTSFPVIVFPFYFTSNFTFEHLLTVIQKTKKSKPKRVVVCTYQVSSEARKFAKNFGEYEILLLDKQETFSLLLEPKKFYPEISPKTPQIKKLSFKSIISSIFNKKQTKTFAFCGIILFFGSLIIRHNLYYVLMSSLLLFFALLSWISPKFIKQKNSQLFE